jgi:hypothetical protein
MLATDRDLGERRTDPEKSRTGTGRAEVLGAALTGFWSPEVCIERLLDRIESRP